MKLSAPAVPKLDVDAVGPTLAEEQNSHGAESKPLGEEKANRLGIK